MPKTLLLILIILVLPIFSNALVHYSHRCHRHHHHHGTFLLLPTNHDDKPSFTDFRHQRSLSSWQLLLSSSTTPSNNNNNDDDDKAATITLTKRGGKLRKIAIVSWTHLISLFVLVNYFIQTTSCWPSWLTQVPSREVWTFVHAVSGMTFSGTILTTTVIEWIVVQSRISSVLQFWFQNVEFFETILVLPALTLSIVSGVAQAFCDYGHLKMAPKHVKGSLHLLFLFGLWWGFTDRTTQRRARVAVEQEQLIVVKGSDNEKDDVPDILVRRRWSNVVSCIFVLALYAVMALKPWYQP